MHNKTDQEIKLEKHKQLMAHFDDIPIHQLHKADGYQIRNIDDSGVKRLGNDEASDNEEAPNLSLKD